MHVDYLERELRQIRAQPSQGVVKRQSYGGVNSSGGIAKKNL
jgi:hypothetical protein